MGAPGASLPRQGSAVVPSWLRKHLLSLLDLMEEAHPDCLFAPRSQHLPSPILGKILKPQLAP